MAKSKSNKAKNNKAKKSNDNIAERYVQFAATLDLLKSEGEFEVNAVVQSAYQKGTIFEDPCRVVYSRADDLRWKKYKGSGMIAVPAKLVAAIEETAAKHPEQKFWKPKAQKNRVPKVWFASYAGGKHPDQQAESWENMVCSRTCKNLWCVHPAHLCWESRKAAELRYRSASTNK